MENQENVIVVEETPKKASGVAIAALVCGLVSLLCCNPLYLTSLAAIVLGIIGIATAKDRPKGMAISGLILGVVSVILWPILDTLITIFTAGIGVFSYFI